MKIAPLLQMMNQSANPIRTNSNPAGLSFSRFLIGDQGVKQIHSIDTKEIPSANLSFQQITDELNLFLSELSIEEALIPSMVVKEEQKIDLNSSTISLLEKEMNGILSDSYSVTELMDQVKSAPTAVGVLALVKTIEDISKETKVDFSSYFLELNSVLDAEYPSYNLVDPIKLSSMISAIDHMKQSDKALIEGEIVLAKWSSSDDTSKLLFFDKLLTINNKLTEAKILPMQEAKVKNDILNEILAVTSNKELENSLQILLGKADLPTIQSFFHKTVENLYGENLTNPQLNNFVNQDQDLSVDLRGFSEAFIFVNDLQNENNKLSVPSSIHKETLEEFQQVSKVESLNENIIEQSNQSEDVKAIEAMLNFLQFGLNQLTEKSGIDLSQVEKEITSLLNQYTKSNSEVLKQVLGPIDNNKQIVNKLIFNFIGSLKLNKQDQSAVETNVKGTFNQIQPNFAIVEINTKLTDQLQIGKKEPPLPIDIVLGQDEATPMINNLLKIAKIGEQVAKELSIDVSDVLSETEKLIQENMSLTDTVSQERLLTNGFTQSKDFVRKEMTNRIAPLIKGVKALVKGIELLSSKLSIDATEIISKVESSLQAEFFEFKQLEQKGTLIVNIPVLYESLLTKLSKQDEKMDGKLGEVSLFENEPITIKSNDPLSSLSTIVPTRQQIIDGAFSQILPQDAPKKVEVREETFTIQLDKFMTKEPVIPIEKQRTVSTTQQEFTNQLLNAFKTSKFAQLPNEANRLIIKLNPEHLGSLTVRLVQKNGEMIARIITSTESAKELLDHSVHQLKQALPTIQIEIERFDVNSEQLVRTLSDNSDEKEKKEKEYVESRTDEEEESEESFIDSLKEALNTTV